MNDVATVENDEDQAAAAAAAEIEGRARAMGWRPKEEFRGPADKWVPAEEFVRRGEEILPIVNAKNKRLEEEVSSLKSQLGETTTVIKDFRDQYQRGVDAAYKRGRADLEKEREAAVAEGDTAKFKAVQAQIDELDTEHRQAVQPAAPSEQPRKDGQGDAPRKDGPQLDPYVHTWVAENPWFNSDSEARAFASALDRDLMQSIPDIRDRLSAVKEKVRKRFPELFSNPRRDSAASVATPSGNEGGGTRKKGPSYADLPADAKAACDRFVKQGIMTKEQYVESYDWS